MPKGAGRAASWRSFLTAYGGASTFSLPEAAQALANVIQDKPIVFVAVTDPVAAGLVPSWEAPDANVTSTR